MELIPQLHYDADDKGACIGYFDSPVNEEHKFMFTDISLIVSLIAALNNIGYSAYRVW